MDDVGSIPTRGLTEVLMECVVLHAKSDCKSCYGTGLIVAPVGDTSVTDTSVCSCVLDGMTDAEWDEFMLGELHFFIEPHETKEIPF